MKEHQLPSQIKSVWKVSALLTALFELMVILGLFVANKIWHWPMWIVMIGVILAVIWTSIDFALIPYRYAFSHYQITATAVYLKSGYIFRTEESIPIIRIQNVTLEAGPLLQHWQLQKLNVETASTTHTIEGITIDTANQLRDQILQLAQEAQNDF